MNVESARAHIGCLCNGKRLGFNSPSTVPGRDV
jgi:hypothetical protein